MHVDHPAGFTHLEHQSVRSDERIRAGIERPGPERLHGGVEFITDTCDFDNDVMPRVSTSLSIRRVETPSR
ncbi:hypothetical protein MAUB_58740 [Mycolicibacterium aubagnense]|uniref:Uncharacterized protein n=1 Tax=Mycolicibacterium aubagnense TaxID=319707 RepID=A0ABN5Z4Q6_9MYCO|nr:hypothetical protein MAUB_58740 [Mycolicibacterium aubagnense]